MKLVFIARHFSYFRLFESAIAGLAERGHDILLAADREEALGGRQLVERLAELYPNIRIGTAPGRHTGAWSELARRIRLGLDYLRFLDPRYASTPHLRRRAEDRAPRIVVRVAAARLLRSLGVRRLLAGLLRLLELGVPVAPRSEEFLRIQAPDLLLITPLVDLGSPQLDHFAAARRLGLRTVLPVGSWDHLSSKALLREFPERVIVWNDSQRAEAIDLHGVPQDRVVVTGAQCYDQWFGRSPSQTRDQFCARVGLSPDRPFVLYVASSLFRGTADEPAFTEEWVQAVRSSNDPRLEGIGILIRPHPSRLDEWNRADFSGYRNLATWGAHPVDQESKDDYFDSMYYSAGVVGLNTSAFLEAAVVGKPVHTVIVPEISRENQEGTIHFRYLLDVNGGLLHVARSLDEHVANLAETLVPQGGGDEKSARFIDGFIRPYGADVAATPKFVEAVEAAASLPAPPARAALVSYVGYALLYPAAALISLNLRTQPWRKRKRHHLQKWYGLRRTLLFRRIKQFAVDHLGTPGKRRKIAVTQVGESALTPKAGRRRDPAKTLGGLQLRESREAREMVTVLGRSGRPLILGPWLSETGFELLYWIPFLAWAKAYGNFDPDRMVAVSRGGAASWYAHITPHYEETFSFVTPDRFRIANDRRIHEQGGRLKHVEMSALDREIIDMVRTRRGMRDAEVLHPSLMYRLFGNFWHQHAPMTLLEAFTLFSTLAPAPDSGIRAHLPERYVAAKFYGNSALPDTPENRAFIGQYLSDLAKNTDIVLLNTGQQFDDHLDFAPTLLDRIHTIDHLMQPHNNLAIQSDVIRHAQAFVGTYGGFSYLAPLSGVDTIAFYSHAVGFRVDHLEVAKRVFAGLRCGSFVELDTRAVDVVRLGFGSSTGPVVGSR